MFIHRSLILTAPRVTATRAMATKAVFVGNLPFRVTEADLREHFNDYRVEAIRIPTDMEGRSKGFGFAEIDEADIDEAVGALNGTTLDGRAIRVSIAEQREERFRGDERDMKRVYSGNRDDDFGDRRSQGGGRGYGGDRGSYSRGRGDYGGGRGRSNYEDRRGAGSGRGGGRGWNGEGRGGYGDNRGGREGERSYRNENDD